MILWLLAAVLSAQEQCKSCHTEHVEDFLSHKHASAKLSCEVCHGASEKHRKAVGSASPDRVAAPDEVPALCGGCHADALKVYSASKHGQAVAAKGKAANCGTCHGVHAPRWGAAMAKQCARCHADLPAACKATPGRVNARLACAACHEQHGLARR